MTPAATASVAGSPADRLPVEKRFKPGQSGNPGGKPVAARNRLQGSFLNTLADDFDANGKAAIVKCREDDPAAYIRAIVALMPKEIELTRQFDDLTDEQLAAAVIAARSLAAAIGIDPGEGTAVPPLHQPAENVSALSEAG